MLEMLRRFIAEETGMEPIEYALLLALASLVAIVGANQMAKVLFGTFTDVAGSVADVEIDDVGGS